MALATYSDLIASAASWSTRSDLTAQMPDFVAWADQEIARRLRANVMLATTTITVGSETVAQPTGFLAIKRLYLDVTPRVRIGSVDAGVALDMSASEGTATYPRAVAVEGANFRFAPLFSSSATGQLLYYAQQTPLSATNATNAVYAKYPYLYLFGTLEALYDYLEDTDNSNSYGGKFGALIQSINDAEAADARSGPVAILAPGGGLV